MADLSAQLLRAVNLGDVGLCLTALARGAQASAADQDGWTLRHRAAVQGDAPVCRVLLDHGGHIDALDKWDRSVLAIAIRSGHAPLAPCCLSVASMPVD